MVLSAMLQQMAKRCGEVQEDSEREETRWLERLTEGRKSRKRKMDSVQHGDSVIKWSRLE